MIKHNFKIGDRVRLKNGSYCGIYSKDTGKVVGIKRYIEVLWGESLGKRLCSNTAYPHKPNEIEHAAKVGEQLLFNFMEGERNG